MLGWIRQAVALLIAIGAVPPAAAQDVAVEPNVMIPARDGIRLATDIYRPARGGVAEPGRRPVLFLRTPYDKGNDALTAQAHYFARNGYVVALQDARGRYRSGGTFTKYASDDSRDGYDSIEWLAAQPWSDGRVGMWGTSYAAHAQADADKLNPPHLATMVLNQGGMTDALGSRRPPRRRLRARPRADLGLAADTSRGDRSRSGSAVRAGEGHRPR